MLWSPTPASSSAAPTGHPDWVGYPSKERTRAELAAAAAYGRTGGRPRKVDGADAAKARISATGSKA